jgi:hypothetical protein
MQRKQPCALARGHSFLEEQMTFQATRTSHEYTQTNLAPPERVFPLLCPVREADWVPGWQYRLIHSQSGVAEMGCVFSTPNEDGSETTWVVAEYDSADLRIAFVWVNPGLVAAHIQIRLERSGNDQTSAHIRYSYTGLSPDGNAEVARYDASWFLHKMQSWETAINHYLRSGKCIEERAWE